MDERNKTRIAEEIQKLARRLKRLPAHSYYHAGRKDRLRLLLLENDGISMKDLARLIDIRPSSLSERLDKLIADGEISKTRDEQDKRAVRISLTEKGRAIAQATKKESEGATDLLADCLTQEEALFFVEICGKLYDHLNKAVGYDKPFKDGRHRGEFGGKGRRHHRDDHKGKEGYHGRFQGKK